MRKRMTGKGPQARDGVAPGRHQGSRAACPPPLRTGAVTSREQRRRRENQAGEPDRGELAGGELAGVAAVLTMAGEPINHGTDAR